MPDACEATKLKFKLDILATDSKQTLEFKINLDSSCQGIRMG